MTGPGYILKGKNSHELVSLIKSFERTTSEASSRQPKKTSDQHDWKGGQEQEDPLQVVWGPHP